MKSDHHTIYSIQPTTIVDQLHTTGKYIADWKWVDADWGPAYQYMCQQMYTSGIDIGEHAPVWAWAEPKEKIGQLAEELLSETQWEHGVSVLELHVPKHQVLLSSYFHWNQLLDDSLETGVVTPPAELFSISDCEADDVIQAVLPYIQQTWVQDTYILKR